MNKCLLLILMTAGGAAVNEKKSANRLITPEIVLELSSQPLPVGYQEAASRFLADYGAVVEQWTIDLLPQQNITGTSFSTDLEAITELVDTNTRILDEYAIVNKSKSMHLVAHITPQISISLSSVYHRWNNKNIQQGKQRDAVNSLEQSNIWTATHPTYQTVSMALEAQYLNHIIAQEGIDKIAVPQTWLVPFKKEGDILVMDANPTDISDKNTFVVQENLQGKNPVRLKENPARLADIDETTFTQWLQLIAYGALWDSVSNMYIDDTNKLELAHVQQPDNSNPDDFFHKDKQKLEWNTTVGFEQIADFCVAQKDAHKLQVIQDFVVTQVTPTMEYHGEYLKQHVLAKKIS